MFPACCYVPAENCIIFLLICLMTFGFYFFFSLPFKRGRLAALFSSRIPAGDYKTRALMVVSPWGTSNSPFGWWRALGLESSGPVFPTDTWGKGWQSPSSLTPLLPPVVSHASLCRAAGCSGPQLGAPLLLLLPPRALGRP